MKRPLRILGIVAAAQLAFAGTAFTASDPLGGACKEIRLAQAKRIFGNGVKLSSGADRHGGRSLCFLSVGAAGIAISSEPSRLFRAIVESNRSDPRYAKGFTAVNLGDEGYRWDAYDLGAGGSTVFNAHVLLFRVGNRMFTVTDEKLRGRVTASARFALAKVVAQNARSK